MLLILSKRFENRYFGASGQSHIDVYNTEANHLQTSLVHLMRLTDAIFFSTIFHYIIIFFLGIYHFISVLFALCNCLTPRSIAYRHFAALRLMFSRERASAKYSRYHILNNKLF